MAAGPGPLQAHLRHRRADAPGAAGQRRQAVAAPAGRNAVRPGRHVQPVQARELSQRRRAARAASPRPSPAATIRTGGYRGLDPFNTSENGARSTGSTRAPTPACTQRRHPRHPHPGDGADHRPQPRAEVRPAVLQPRQRAAAHPRRDPGAQVRPGRASSRSTPTATPTPASWPRFRPTWPSRSRRWTRTAWC